MNLPAYIIYPISIPIWVIRIFTSIVKLRPHVVHIHNLTDIAIASAIVKILLKKIGEKEVPCFITTVHGRDLIEWLIKGRRTFLSKINETLQRLCSTMLDHVVFTNPLAFSYAKRWYISAKASVIPLGVVVMNNTVSNTVIKEYRKKILSQGKPLIFLSVSRIDKDKNIDTLLLAFSEFVKCFKYEMRSSPHKVNLVIVGSGPLYCSMKNLASKLNLNEHVTFLGRVTEQELNILYESADCVIVPSIYEGFSLVVLEALAHGKPVIAYKYLPAIISLPYSVRKCLGVLVDGPTEEGLSKALLEFIEKMNELHRYSGLRRNIARKLFNWDVVSLRYKSLYLRLLREREKRILGICHNNGIND